MLITVYYKPDFLIKVHSYRYKIKTPGYSRSLAEASLRKNGSEAYLLIQDLFMSMEIRNKNCALPYYSIYR